MFFGDYIDSPPSPLFPFGHGLDYTDFTYEDLQVDASTTAEPVTLSLTLRNVGDRAGEEVVQLYCRDDLASLARPDRMLVGFARISLEPGQGRRLTFSVHPSRLAFYDPAMRFVTEPGTFTFSVGASSTDIRLERRVELTGEVSEYRQREIVATSCSSASLPS